MPRSSVIGLCVCELTRPGNQRGVRARHDFLRRESLAHLRARADGDDAVAFDRDGMVVPDFRMRLDRHDPAGFDQDIAGLLGVLAHPITSCRLPKASR
ncbi:hypothetical protein ACVWWW_001239 [Lysobacter sp. HA18]